MLLEVENLYKQYGKIRVLRGVTFSLNQGEIVCLLGESGAGKSTLLHLIGALDDPDKGEIRFEGQNIRSYSRKQTAFYRNTSIGLIFQFHHLLPEFTALENVALPAWIAGLSKKEGLVRAEELLERLEIINNKNRKPTELSGGEQQRVAIARALVNSPKLILADEPTGNLDSHNSDEIHSLFLHLGKNEKQTFLIATHNQRMTGGATRCLTIRDGTIFE